MTASKQGIDLLLDPSLNTSTAFTKAQRQVLGIVGLVPDALSGEAPLKDFEHKQE
jgi:hypothetical protein